MKALYLGRFNDHCLGGDLIIEKGFSLNHVDIIRLDYHEILQIEGEEKLQELAQNISRNVDLIIIGKGLGLPAKILKSIKRSSIEVILWYGDIRESVETWLKELLPYVDTFFMSSAGEVLKYYSTFMTHSKKAAYYFNPSDPELIKDSTTFEEKSTEILFSGTPYGFACEERLNTISYLKKRNDTQFIGGAQYINFYRTNNLYNKIMRKIYKGKHNRLRGTDYIKAIKSAKVAVGVSAFQNIEMYSSDRLTHFTSFGTFYMPYYFPKLEELFSKNELVSFKSISDLDNKLNYYLKNEVERESIAEIAKLKVLTEYNTKNMTKMMLDIVKTGKSIVYPWVEVYQ